MLISLVAGRTAVSAEDEPEALNPGILSDHAFHPLCNKALRINSG
jgi:hypothetical protein